MLFSLMPILSRGLLAPSQHAPRRRVGAFGCVPIARVRPIWKPPCVARSVAATARSDWAQQFRLLRW